MLAVGVSLLVAAALVFPRPTPGSAGAKRGGTLRVDRPERFRLIDPNLSPNWGTQHATQLYLIGTADKTGAAGTVPIPEAAVGFPRVSADGRTFTFTIKRGLRFSDGTPVTAANFAYSLNRALNPTLQSPASYYLSDVVGAKDVVDGRTETASGITTPGKHTLVVKLTNPAPDFPARLTFPILPAVSLGLPVIAGGVTDAPLASAGPYYVKEYNPDRSEVLVRNPYWRSDLVPQRQANPDRIVFTLGISLEEGMAHVERNATDLAPFPDSAVRDLARKYGVNRARFFVGPAINVWYLAFNHHHGLFANNPKLRQAVNYAIDRPALARTFGFLGARRTDQLLPPGFPGFVDVSLYPLRGADITTARRLAGGHTRSGHAVLYTTDFERQRAIAGILKFELAQIGITVEVREFDVVALFDRLARPEEQWDFADVGWIADYPDPYDFICPSRRSGTCALQQQGLEFPDPVWNRKIEAVSRRTGAARSAEFAKVEADLLREAAPVAPYAVDNNRVFFGKDVGCVTLTPFQAALGALCKK
jgi:peptide/nickel transport system substrate-binding protein